MTSIQVLECECRVRELLLQPRWSEEEYCFLTEFLKFSEEEKREANRRVSLEVVLAGQGIYFPAGKRHPQVKCFLPGHHDDTPSMTLYREDNRCYCFGCHGRLTPLEALVQLYGYRYREAMDYLLGDSPRQQLRRQILARFGEKAEEKLTGNRKPKNPLPEPELLGLSQLSRMPEKESLTAERPEVQRLLEATVNQYQAELESCQPALDYLQSRGLAGETVRRYRLGYGTGVWLAGWLRQTGQDLGLAHRVGLLAEGNRERLAGRIILPYQSQEGKILHLTGRYLFSPTRAREVAGLPATPQNPVAVLHSPKYLGLILPKPDPLALMGPEQEYLLLVEGPFDWLVLRQWGYEAACLFGTAVGGEKLAGIKSVLESGQLKRLYLCLDNDPPVQLPGGKAVPGAGPRATREILEFLATERAIPLRLPAGFKDVASLGEVAEGQTLFAGALQAAVKS